MRIAVSLPSLSAAAIERHQIEAAIRELARLADVEVFGESTRLREGELPATAHHYLRLPERHVAAPFDAALHPIGRDFRPYEPSVLLSRCSCSGIGGASISTVGPSTSTARISLAAPAKSSVATAGRITYCC